MHHLDSRHRNRKYSSDRQRKRIARRCRFTLKLRSSISNKIIVQGVLYRHKWQQERVTSNNGNHSHNERFSSFNSTNSNSNRYIINRTESQKHFGISEQVQVQGQSEMQRSPRNSCSWSLMRLRIISTITRNLISKRLL